MNSAKFKEYLRDTVDQCRLPGATSCLLENDEIYSGSSGYIDSNKTLAYSSESIIRVGCLAKVFTATLIMMLVDEERISLESTLVQFIPELADEKYGLSKITIEQLLNHSSGLISGLWSGECTIVDTHNIVALVSILSEKDLFVQNPGISASYSSLGYIFLALVIEKVRGRTWISEVNQKIFIPLEIFCWQLDDSNLKKRLAPQGDCLQTGFDTDRLIPEPPEAIHCAVGGSLALTANDLIKFSQVFIGGNLQKSLLSDNAIRLMQEKISTPAGPWPGLTGLAFGFLAYDDGSFGFTGNGINNHVLLRYNPKSRIALTVVANYHSATLLFETLWRGISKRESLNNSAANMGFEDDFDTTKVIGTYTDGMLRYDIRRIEGGEFRIVYSNMHLPNDSFKIEAEIIHLNANHFVAPEIGNFSNLWLIDNLDRKSMKIWNGITLFKKISD